MKLIFLIIAIQSLVIFNSSAQNLESIKASYSVAKKEFALFERKHGKFIKTDNVNMHYLSWGNSSNPCFIWVHGSMNNGYELMDIAENFVKAGFYLIAIDYYGHGQTEIPNHEVSIYHVADDIKFMMNSLSIEKAFIGGFSRGGHVATAFYDNYPESVLGLVLEDGGSVSANTNHHKLSLEALGDKAKTFDIQTKQPWDIIYDTQFEVYKELYDNDAKGSQFPILALTKKIDTGKWFITYSSMMLLFHLRNGQEFLDLTLRPTKVPLFARSMMMMEPKIIFRKLNVPILILDPLSKNDPFPFEKENLALKSQHSKYIDYISYLNTEHNIHYQHPAQFASDVITFLKKSIK